MKLWKEIILGNRFEWAEINMGWLKAKSWKRLIAEKLQGWALSYSEKMGIILLRKAAAYLCSELKADFPRHLIYHSSPYSFSVKSAPPHITGPCSRCHKLPCIKTENGIRFLWLLHDPSFSPCTQKNGDTRNLAPVKCFGLDDLQRSLPTSAILWSSLVCPSSSRASYLLYKGTWKGEVDREGICLLGVAGKHVTYTYVYIVTYIHRHFQLQDMSCQVIMKHFPKLTYNDKNMPQI